LRAAAIALGSSSMPLASSFSSVNFGRSTRPQPFMRELGNPVFANTAHQRHHKNIAARLARGKGGGTRQVAATRYQA
jgi:hypothetical protein